MKAQAIRWCVVFACAVGAGAAAPALAQPAAKVRLDPVRLERLEQRREVTGELHATRHASVAAEVAGRVVSLEVEIGDEVRAGEIIARLDDKLAALEVQRRDADVLNRQAVVSERLAQLEQAQRDLEIFLGMGDGATSSEVDNARTAVAAATARVAGAHAEQSLAAAELEIARERQIDHVVRAPFDGQVVTRETEIGEWLGAGDTVIQLLALDQVDAIINVPQQDITRVSSGDASVVIRIDAVGREIEARVAAVIATGDRLSRTFPVRIRLDNTDHTLRPGMSIIGLVPTGHGADMLTVHKDAVLRNATGPYIYIDGGGVAAMLPVRIRFAHGERFAVTANGLEAGADSIVEGNEYIFPGQPLLRIDGAPAPGRQEH